MRHERAKRRVWPRIGVVVLVVVLLAVAAGWLWREAWPAVFGPDYEVVNSGMAASIEDIFWLDNRRVIFLGTNEPKPRTVEEKLSRDTAKILIWDTETNEVRVYDPSVPNRSICYADGRLYYPLGEAPRAGTEYGVFYYMAGSLGEERRHEFLQDKAVNDRWRFNEFSCGLVKRPAVVPDGGGWMPLKAEHGFLRFVPVKDQYYMDVIFLDGSKSIKLPFNDEETWPTIAEWYALQGGYFMYEPATSNKERARWQETNCLRAWWLYPNGETESTCVPAGVWAEYGADFIAPIRDGFVFSVLTQPSDVRGLHVVIDGESSRIIGGLTEKPVVSPNGCQIAFAHAPTYAALRPGGEGRRTLKMVDVCDERLSHEHQ